jgi:chromosome segregation ATPase
MAEEEEYELIPVSPIKKLEARLKKLEAQRAVDISEFFKELISIIRMNQSLVNELAKASDSLRIELSKLPAKIDRLVESQSELIRFIKAAAEEERPAPPSELKAFIDRIDKLLESNARIVEGQEAIKGLLERICRRIAPPLPPPIVRRPEKK